MRICRGRRSASEDTGPFSPSTSSISWNAPSTRRTTRMSCFANSLPPEYSSRKNASRYFASSSAHSSAVYRERKCKFDATRCQILRLKCTKFDFRWGSLQRSPIAPSLFLKGGRGRKRGTKREREGKMREKGGPKYFGREPSLPLEYTCPEHVILQHQATASRSCSEYRATQLGSFSKHQDDPTLARC